MTRAARCTILICLAALLPACGVGQSAQRISKENDRLRRENLELRKQVDTMQENIARRVAELDALREREQTGPQPVKGAEVPRLARIRFDRFSGPHDADRDGRPEVVRIYLNTEDQGGRFVSVAGELHLRLIAAPSGESPTVVAEKHVGPDAFSKAYRQGFTGVYYSFEMKMPDNLPANLTSLIAQATFTNADTGAQHTAEKTFALER